MELCTLCCYSFTGLAKGSREGVNKVQTIKKFCKQVGRDNDGLSESLSWSLCGDCLEGLASAVEKREKAEEIEVQVRSLQIQVLRLMKDLQQCMGGYLKEMRVIEEKIKGSDVTSGKRTKRPGGSHILQSFQLRNEILEVVKELSAFQDQLSLKANPTDNFPSDAIPAAEPVKIEAVDIQEEPDFSNLPDANSQASPVESEVEGDEMSDPTWEEPEFFDLPDDTCSPESCQEEELESEDISDPTWESEEPISGSGTKRSTRSTTTKKPRKLRGPYKKMIKNKEIPEKITKPTWITSSHVSYKQGTRIESHRSYHCQTCPDFTAKSPYHLEQHLREHELTFKDIPKSFKCPHCTLSYSLKQLYEYHVICHSRIFKSVCDQCNKRMASLEIAPHLKKKHGVTKIFQCANCVFVCSVRETYLEHLRMKHYGPNVIMACDLCTLIFHSRKDHLEHLHQVHNAIEVLECGIDGCTMTFLEQCHRRLHQVLHTRPLSCEECGQKFANGQMLERHKLSHSENRPWKCSRCPKSFKLEDTLKKHEKLHDRDEDGSPAFQCHLCEKSYKCEDSLEAHLRLHQGTGYTCVKCGATFGYKYVYKKHLETHSEERKFCCDHCGKAFKTVAVLKKHVMTQHENTEKNLKCPDCPKMFTHKEYLRQHSRVHKGDYRFVCNVCGKAFHQASSHWYHKKHIHPDPVDGTPSRKQE